MSSTSDKKSKSQSKSGSSSSPTNKLGKLLSRSSSSVRGKNSDEKWYLSATALPSSRRATSAADNDTGRSGDLVKYLNKITALA